MELLNILIGFHEPFTGAWVEGVKTLGIRKAAEKVDILKRYEAALKERYGDSAYAMEE